MFVHSSDTVECVMRESESLTFCPSVEFAEYVTSSKLTQEAGNCSTGFQPETLTTGYFYSDRRCCVFTHTTECFA